MASAMSTRDKIVLGTFTVLGVSLLVAVGTAVKARHELETFRNQSAQIERKLGELEESFSVIREYTGNFSSLAVPRDKPWLKDLKANKPLAQGGGFMTLSFAAKNHPTQYKPTDLELYDRMLQQVEGLNRDTQSVVGRLNTMAVVLQNHKELIRTIPSRIPVAVGEVTSEYGYRLSPFGGARSMHAGVDIAAETGEPILAPADGVVTFSGDFNSLGKTIVLDHGTGVLTRYGHASKLLVRRGQKVKRGTIIGHVGNTGNSTGPHLHYEVWVNNRAVNPRNFFFDVTQKPQALASWRLEDQSVALTAANGMGGD